MSVNLLKTLQRGLGDSLIKNASGFLNESEETASKAVKGTYSVLLASVIDKGSTEKGAANILKVLKKGGHHVPAEKEVGKIFSRSPQTINGLVNIGNRDLPAFFGNKQREATNMVAEESGVKKQSASLLMKLSSPFLMNLLGKQVADNNLDANGLMNFLQGQKSHITNSLPAEAIDKLELSSFGWTKKEPVVKEKKKVKKKSVVKKEKIMNHEKVKKATVEPVKATVATQETGGGIGHWLLWLIPLLLIGALAFFGLRQCNPAAKTAAVVTDTTTAVAEGTGNIVKGAGDMAKGAVDKVVNAFGTVNQAALDALSGIKFAAGSAGSQMLAFIKGGGNGEGKFRFNNLNFASGSATIAGESGAEVDNLAAILKAYSDLKVSVEGYTDNTGSAEKNITLSKQRADAVQQRLVAAGIASDRITTQGFGAANPIADNGTPEGRAENRRIEVVLVK